MRILNDVRQSGGGWRRWQALLLLAASCVLSAQADNRDWAIVDVNVIPMSTQAVLPGQTVVIRAGRISEIGPADEVEAGDLPVISGAGRYLMPGLAEMHAHIPPQPDSVQETLDILALYVANGITLARGMLGAPHHLELRDSVARGEVFAPRIVTSGPSLNGRSVPTPEAGREMVLAQYAAGYDFLKIHPGLDHERFAAIVAAAQSVGIPFAGHVSEVVGLRAALAAGQATIDHLDQYLPALLPTDSPLAGEPAQFFGWNLAGEADPSRIPALAEETRAAGTWNVPTQSLIEQLLLEEHGAEALLARPEMRYVAPATATQWAAAKTNLLANPAYSPALARQFVTIRRQLIKALHDAGAGLLLGSDAPQIFNVPGFSIHEELRLLVAAGLSPFEALATGTVAVARFLGEPDGFGQVAVGHRADLLLLEANPLEDVAHVRRRFGVMVDGRWHDAVDLEARLLQIAARASGS